MDTMIGFFIAGVFMVIAGSVWLYPDIFVPRCPVCSAPLELDVETDVAWIYIDWQQSWLTYYCKPCSQRHRITGGNNSPVRNS